MTTSVFVGRGDIVAEPSCVQSGIIMSQRSSLELHSMSLTLTQAHPPIALKRLSALIEAFPSMSESEKKAFIETLVAAHPTVNLEWGGDWLYRRCRKLEPGDIPENVDHLIWRKDTPAQLGRANPAGFNVIYLADRRDTSLSETYVQKSLVVVAEFKIAKNRSLRVVPIGELARIQRTGKGFLLDGEAGYVSRILNACSPDEAKSLLITDAFLLECFVGSDGHNLSSHLAYSIFNKNRKFSAISYPSRRQFGAINFAVRVENFWEVWGLAAVSYGEAEHLAMGYYNMDIQKVVDGVYSDGRLRWIDADNPNDRLLLNPLFTP